MKNVEINRYTFGTLTVAFRGLGVPFLGDRALSELDAMSPEALKEANREAWKQLRSAARIANSHCNLSAPGNMSTYDRASQHYMVADQVRKETYRRMMRAA